MMCLVLGASNDKSCRKRVFSGWAAKDMSCGKDVFSAGTFKDMSCGKDVSPRQKGSSKDPFIGFRFLLI